MMAQLLTLEGFVATAVANGREALEYLRQGDRPDIILLDLMMPVMDGWGFRIAQRHDPTLAKIPVIVLTAVVDPVLEARKLRAVAGFRKPLDVYALLDVVSEYCPQRR